MQASTGPYNKYHVHRLDGRDAPGGDRHGARYFVLDLDHDPHAREALRTYADECEDAYPQLAADLRAEIDRLHLGEFVTVPETTLPNGTVVPAFRVAKHLSRRTPDGAPWVEINYQEARAACQRAGAALITETQWLAVAHQIANQPENWTGGAVGEGSLYMGLHLGIVDEAQGPAYESPEAIERRWHVLANGERIYDFAGNAYSWVFDDVQGDKQGLIAKPFSEDSLSITTAPFPSMEKGMGWRPSAGADWSGHALIRGGYWNSVVLAGVFHLDYDWPEYRVDSVGFRCTQPIGL
ncbi:MAG: hypothetical protein NDI70_09370 [Pseudomonas sagittaria]|nr:hypothetical protein [Pseudomonas sagittaria]